MNHINRANTRSYKQAKERLGSQEIDHSYSQNEDSYARLRNSVKKPATSNIEYGGNSGLYNTYKRPAHKKS
jgi:hypothetical protein